MNLNASSTRAAHLRAVRDDPVLAARLLPAQQTTWLGTHIMTFASDRHAMHRWVRIEDAEDIVAHIASNHGLVKVSCVPVTHPVPWTESQLKGFYDTWRESELLDLLRLEEETGGAFKYIPHAQSPMLDLLP